MINRSFTTFNRNYSEGQADFGEKAGDIGLGLLRVGFGKTFTVKKVSGNADTFTFRERLYSTNAKVAAIAVFIFMLPITAPLAGIGYIGMRCSKSHKEMFNSYLTPVKAAPHDIAATTIQKHFRGFLARKAHLAGGQYPQYKAQCEKAIGPESHTIPQANGGKTKVYLPQDMSGVVLKHSGRRDAITRFHQMQEIRSILKAQNSSHLIIPKANLYQDFLVEQRLPINTDSYHNMGLYISEPALFDEAVRELTRLFSKVYLSDLVGYQINPLGHIDDVEDFVRYDNLPLYVVENEGRKEGKIGLIDLEHMHKEPNPYSLATLARIFPLHTNIIRDEAHKLNMNIDERLFNKFYEKGKKYLQVGFSEHLEWIRKNPQTVQISSQRVEEVASLLEKELLSLNQGVTNFPKNFLKENPEEAAKELASTIAPLLISNLKAKIAKQESKTPREDRTESAKVSLRSPTLKRRKLYAGVTKILANHQKFENRVYHDRKDIAERLTATAFKELVRGGEIFYYDPAYYSGGHDLCWVRY